MKCPFPRFRIRNLTHLQLQIAVTRVVKEAKTAVASCLTMKQQVVVLETSMSEHQQALTRETGSDLSPFIKAIDEKRDRGTKQFFGKVKLLITDFNSATAADAQSIYRPIEQQGGNKLTRKPLAEQSAGTAIIINELSVPAMQEKMDRLGVIQDFERMAALNNEFETLWRTRVASTPVAQEYPMMKEVRLRLERTLRSLIDNIEFMYLENQPLISDALYNAIRTLIVELDSTIELRNTADTKAKTASEQESLLA